MGNGIAHVVALAGYDVAINDLKKEAVDKARATIERNMARQVSRGIITDAEMQSALKRIRYAPDLAALGEADLVIEAATEDEAVKRKIFIDLCPKLKQERHPRHQHLLDLDHPARLRHRPARALHRHAFHEPGADDAAGRADPRHRHRGRDLRRSRRTFIESLGKTIAVSEDFPAFIVNRILLPMINEAVYTLYEGVGTVEAIDKAMRLGANHPMGPLELADFIGLDTCLSVMQVLYEGLANSKYRPCPLLVKYVEAGWLGRKTQRGFYDYRGEKPVPTR